MAASPTRPSAEPPAAPPRIAVAVSGGRDSIALLHCTARLARGAGLAVVALHVHHGLMPQADAWQHQLQRQCRRWARRGLPVTLAVARLQNKPPAGASIEAWARGERYRALAALAGASGCRQVLLAHHRRDQAETFLLQALRGGAPRGLASMPARAKRGQIEWLRPWLSQPREAIEAYVARHRLRWVDDDSNVEPRFDRNRLRAEIWPALQRAFPEAETTLAAAGARAQETVACLSDLAALDLGDDLSAGLELARWRPLSAPRRANALRHVLERLLGQGAPQTLVERLLRELPGKTSGRWLAPGGELRLYDGWLRFAPHTAAAVAAPPVPVRLDLSRPGRYDLPGGQGVICVSRARQGGIAPFRLRAVEARPRTGGERFAFGPDSLPRNLKKQFQASRVPEWERAGPLLYEAGGDLLFVPGLGVDGRRRAQPGAPQLTLRWERKPADRSGR